MIRKLSLLCISFFLTILILELALRIYGHYPKQDHAFKINEIEPASPICADEVYGYRLLPGKYTYNYESGFSFTATHNSEGFRITGQKDNKFCKQIGIYGSSLFYGFGLEDASTFPWKLQQKLDDKNMKVNNFAIFGHSPVFTWLLLKDQIEMNMKPDIAIITFANYNEERVVYSMNFRQNIYPNKHNFPKELNYPFARIKGDSLQINKAAFSGIKFPGNKNSSIVNLALNFLEEKQLRQLKAKQVHLLVLKEIVALCLQNNIKPVLYFITADKQSQEEALLFQKLAVDVIMSKVDFTNVKYNLIPYDNHPNEAATSIYAEEVELYINNLQGLPDCNN